MMMSTGCCARAARLIDVEDGVLPIKGGVTRVVGEENPVGLVCLPVLPVLPVVLAV